MTVSLYYDTLQSVPPEARAAILANIESLYENWQPWREGIELYSNDDGPLEGSTKLFAMLSQHQDGDRIPVEEQHDSLMTALDLEFIVTWMHRTAHRHALVWSLSIDDVDVGTIGAEGPDAAAETMLAEMLEAGGAPTLEIARQRSPAIGELYGCDDRTEAPASPTPDPANHPPHRQNEIFLMFRRSKPATPGVHQLIREQTAKRWSQMPMTHSGTPDFDIADHGPMQGRVRLFADRPIDPATDFMATALELRAIVGGFEELATAHGLEWDFHIDDIATGKLYGASQ